MSDSTDELADLPDPCDEVDRDALLAYAAEPVGERGSEQGTAIVALVTRCAALTLGREPPPPADVRRDFRHPAVAIGLLADRFVDTCRSEESAGCAAAAAHLGMCLLLLYIESGTAVASTSTTAATRVTPPKEAPSFPMVVFPTGEIMPEPPPDLLGRFVRDMVEELIDAPRAPRALCELTRRAIDGARGPDAGTLLADIDAAVRKVGAGAIAYGRQAP